MFGSLKAREHSCVSLAQRAQIRARTSKMIDRPHMDFIFFLILMERHKFSTEERCFLMDSWWDGGKNYVATTAAFELRFPGVAAPKKNWFYKTRAKFRKIGTVADASRSGRPKSARTQENIQAVQEALIDSPQTSTRRL